MSFYNARDRVCPFKKIIRITEDEDKIGEKKITTDFGECNWCECTAAITCNTEYGEIIFNGCRRIRNER